MIHEVGNIEPCELLDTEPKTQCKVCLSYWDVVIVYCTCGHFLRNGTEENNKYVQYTMDLLSIPNYHIKKGRPHGHRYGKKPGDHESYIANSLKKNCKTKFYLGIHDRFIRDEKFRKNMFDIGRTEEICREMDKLADEDYTHHITPEEIRVYRNNWWIRSRCRTDFKQALLTSRQLKDKDDASSSAKMAKAILHLGGTGKNPGGILLMSITTKTDPALIDQRNLLKSDWDTCSSMILRSNLVQYSSKFGNSQQQFTVTDGRCKHYTSNTAKSYVKWL